MLILAFLGLGEQYALILPILYFQGMFPILSEPVRHVFLFIFLFAHSAVALWIGVDHLRVSISTWLRCFVTRQSSFHLSKMQLQNLMPRLLFLFYWHAGWCFSGGSWLQGRMYCAVLFSSCTSKCAFVVTYPLHASRHCHFHFSLVIWALFSCAV